MKKIVLSVITLAISTLFCYGQNIETCSGIKWETNLSWNQITEKAKEQNKFIFVDCYTTWCLPCKKMEKEVYTNKNISSLFNERFISIKLQMDSTKNNDEKFEKFVNIANEIREKFEITGYPTLLFLSSEGILINKEIGFQTVKQLMDVAVNCSFNMRLYEQTENYKKGFKDYLIMKELAEFVKKVIGDQKLSKQIATDYIDNLRQDQLLNIQTIDFVRDIKGDRLLADKLANEYKSKCLDKLSNDSVYSYENLEFIDKYSGTINSKDKFFKLCYDQPRVFDSILSRDGEAAWIIARTITKEELLNKLIKDKQVLYKYPDWEKLQLNIRNKYDRIDASKIVLDFQIEYYRTFDENWEKWASYKNQRINKYPINKNDGVAITLELNEGGAWDAFLHCNNRKTLRLALRWIDLAINLSKQRKPVYYHYAFLDTKANLLYKLGEVNKAIKVEQMAIKTALKQANEVSSIQVKEYAFGQVKLFKSIIEQMRTGEPTYLGDGAIWDEKVLSRK